MLQHSGTVLHPLTAGATTALAQSLWLERDVGVLSPSLLQALADVTPTVEGSRSSAEGTSVSEAAGGFSSVRQGMNHDEAVWGVKKELLILGRILEIRQLVEGVAAASYHDL